MRKKSQLKTTETTLVLVVFLFLLAFGMIYFGRMYYEYRMKENQETKELLAKKLKLQMQFLSEIQCTKEETKESDCLDILKLIEFSELYEKNKVFYNSIFTGVSVNVYQVYPKILGHQGWSVVAMNESGASGTQRFYIPITLYNSTHDIFTYGYLNISVVQ